MDLRLKHRLVGAAVLLAVAVIFLPMLLKGPQVEQPELVRAPIPDKPAYFEVPLEPVEAPQAPPPMPEPVPVEIVAAQTPPAEPQPTPAPGPRAWVLQVASFTSEKNAGRLRDQLRKKGYVTFLETAKGSKGDVFRVRVGPELDLKKLERIRAAIRKEHKLKGIVMRYP